MTAITRPWNGHMHHLCIVDRDMGVRVGICGTALRAGDQPYVDHPPPCLLCVNGRAEHRAGCHHCQFLWPEERPPHSPMGQALRRAGLLP